MFSLLDVALSVAKISHVENFYDKDTCEFSRFFTWCAPSKKIDQKHVTAHSLLVLKVSKASEFVEFINRITSQDLFTPALI